MRIKLIHGRKHIEQFCRTHCALLKNKVIIYKTSIIIGPY
ncbi:hypothetical protein Agau_P200310 (plasmid) [Agrobacterium tumefaciens F2]|nr:hypothetical protein Agau_P200310 [Agrobacterium tumefaciens F2]